NLKVLKAFPDECVDLIYIDPPFFSGKNYDLVFGDKYAIRAFQDTFEGKKETYYSFMEDRIRHLHRILKSTGSFYLHCDYHANYILREICNKIFCGGKYSDKNFKSEIIWTYRRLPAKFSGFQRMHDTIYLYNKSKNVIWNQLYDELSESTKKAFGGKEVITTLTQEGKKRVRATDSVSKGVPMRDWWYIKPVHGQSKENLRYPTQKPEALLERIIKTSSNEEDIVGDFFCGCGTTLAVAERLNRQWIGVDVSPIGCTVMSKRIGYKLKNVQGMKYSLEQAKNLDWMDFQKWTVKAIDGIPLTKKGADKGIDGWQNNNKFNESVPIQVKQQTIGKIGEGVVRDFSTVIELEKKKGGFIIGFDITKPAKIKIIEIKRKTGRDIIFISFDDLFSREILLRKGAIKPTMLERHLKVE
ncbi:hypothetical protein LCGC14_1211500, partial [marine sediment metagenome]